jgi:uncharacterized protein YrzB (UPF0473 family)
MDNDSVRDLVTVRDEMGNERQFEVEALFEMNGLSYAMLREGEETVVMKVEDQGEDQFLVGLESEGEKSNLLDCLSNCC